MGDVAPRVLGDAGECRAPSYRGPTVPLGGWGRTVVLATHMLTGHVLLHQMNLTAVWLEKFTMGDLKASESPAMEPQSTEKVENNADLLQSRKASSSISLVPLTINK